jgi:hypothetical protein
MNSVSFAEALSNKFEGYVYEIEAGRKFDKIVMARADATFGRGKSVYAFVDRSNGDLIKPAGWAAPAKWGKAWATKFNLVDQFDLALEAADAFGGFLYQR